jgi:hypothetical protein
MKICKNCRWSEPERIKKMFSKETKTTGFLKCKCPQVGVDSDLFEDEITDDSLVLYPVYSEYVGSFAVGPNFGCIHWESESQE